MQHCAHCKYLKVMGSGTLWTFSKTQSMSTTRQGIQLGPDPSGMLQSSLEQFRTTRTLLYPMGHGSMVIPPPVGD